MPDDFGPHDLTALSFNLLSELDARANSIPDVGLFPFTFQKRFHLKKRRMERISIYYCLTERKSFFRLNNRSQKKEKNPLYQAMVNQN